MQITGTNDSSIPAEFGDASPKHETCKDLHYLWGIPPSGLSQDEDSITPNDGSSLFVITTHRRRAAHCSISCVSFFFSVFLFLSYSVTGRHSNPTPACSHTLYCNWLNCFDKREGVKTHLQRGAGLISGCISPHHTHTHTGIRNSPGSRLSLL